MERARHLTLLDGAPSTMDELSDREREVLALMATGLSNHAVAGRLRVTTKTVECHIHSIFAKMRLDSGDQVHRRVLAVLTYLGHEAEPQTRVSVG